MTDRMLGQALDITDAGPERRAAHAAADEWSRRTDPADLREGVVHVITGNRQHGKTTLAGRWLAEAPHGVTRVLLVEHEDVAMDVRLTLGYHHRDMRVRPWRPLVNARLGLEPGVEYAVDNAERFIALVLKAEALPHLLTVGTATDAQVP